MPVDLAERIVFELCRRSFLSLWSHSNPRGRDPGKELCDILAVCDPDVVLFSVKAPRLAESGDTEVNTQRWRRKAIVDSCKQLYGAERRLREMEHVIRSDGSQGLALPGMTERRIHRIAVAAGGKRLMPIESKNFGKGFVHVFDEASLTAALTELNTVSDFVAPSTAERRSR